MPIPLSQLNTWANQGATTSSSQAYASIRHALTKTGSPLADRSVEIFLQGSYANDTNIYGDSDIDVVVLYGSTFHKDFSAWTAEQQVLHERVFPTADYQWHHLQADVSSALRSHYGSAAVRPGKKSIKVQTSRLGRPSDVIPAVEFRRYGAFTDIHNPSAHWGIQFFDSQNTPIVNYPKYHIERGVEKHGATRTAGRYKSVVRIFKNLRSCMVDNGMLAGGVAPSYFIECALYNVPDELFRLSVDQGVPAIISHLKGRQFGSLMCQNGITALIGTEPTQWSSDAFTSFVVSAEEAWNDW